MDDPFRSARIKLARGDTHRAITRREIRRFFNSHPDPTFKVEPEGNQSLGVGDIYRARLLIDQGVPDLPPSFAARFGDILHNYRSVLDHIAWQLVRHGTSWPLPDERAETAVQFPIYDTADQFDRRIGIRLPGVDTAVTDWIKDRFQYDAGANPTSNALIGLARLSNDDKHRELHATTGVLKTAQSNVTLTRCVPLYWRNPAVRPTLQSGSVVAHFAVRVTAPDPKLQIQIGPTVQVLIEGWADMTEMIEGLRREVREILDAPQIRAGIA